jgi:excisionase family DNA binding protein
MSRSFPRSVSAPPGRLDDIFTRLEAVAGSLSAEELLDAIGRTARVDAVLRARHGALEAATTAAPSAPPADAPRYLDAVAAASYLGVSKSTVVRLAKGGSLHPLRPSEGVVRFDRVELDAYISGKKA